MTQLIRKLKLEKDVTRIYMGMLCYFMDDFTRQHYILTSFTNKAPGYHLIIRLWIESRYEHFKTSPHMIFSL